MNTIEWMNLADAAGAWLLTYLLHSTALLVPALLLARFLGQRRLSLQESVLRVALLGALLTSGLQVGMGWEATTGSIPYPTARSISSPAESVAASVPDAKGAQRADRNRRNRESAALSAPQSSASQVSGLTLAVGLWASVGLFLVGRLMFLAGRLQRRLRRRSDVESGSVFRLFWRLLAVSDVDKPTRLTRTDRLDVPIALGVGRREICLPDRVVDELPQEQQETVLAHELAHIERHDPAWLLLARALESLFFVQPLNRVARRKLQEIAEYRCDDWAAEQTGHPLTLAKCLTAVATWSADRRLAGLAPTMAGRRSGLGQRVRRLLDPKYTGLDTRMPSWWRPLAGVGLILVLVAVPGFSIAEQEPAPEAPPAESVPAPESAPALMEVPGSEDAPIVRPDLIAGEDIVVSEGPPALAPVAVAPSAPEARLAPAAVAISVAPRVAGVAVAPSVAPSVTPSVAPVAPVLATPEVAPSAVVAPSAPVAEAPEADEVKVETRIASRVIPVVSVKLPPTRVAKKVIVKHAAAVEMKVRIQAEAAEESDADAQDESDDDGDSDVEWDVEWDDDDEWDELEEELEALEDEIDEMVDEIEETFEAEIESVTDAIEDELDLIEEEIEETIEAELELFEEEFEGLFEVFENELEILEDELEERFEESDSDRLEERFEADLEQLEENFDDLADRLDDQLDGIEDRVESQLENILEPMFDDGEMDFRLDEIEERVEREGERMERELERALRAAHDRGEVGLNAEERDRLLAEARRMAEAARPTAEEIQTLQAELARISDAVRPSREQLDQLREELRRELGVLKTQAAEGLAVSREELRQLSEKHSG